MQESLQLDKVVLLGRTLREYKQFFDLNAINAATVKVLDCGGGVSSFTAEWNAQGGNSHSVDPIYRLAGTEIAQKCRQDLEAVLEQLQELAHLYVWNFYKNIGGLKGFRELAYRQFLGDYQKHPNRYVNGQLPTLPFADNEFTLSLVSHFLFLYDNQFDFAFHLQAIKELLRVTQEEIRIYPLTDLKGKPSVYLAKCINHPALKQASVEIRKVDFELIRNANQMLVIRK